MNISGTEYRKFEEIEADFGFKAGTIKRLCDKYKIAYRTLGSAKLLSDADLEILMDRDTKAKEELRKKQSKRAKEMAGKGKLGRKKASS